MTIFKHILFLFFIFVALNYCQVQNDKTSQQKKIEEEIKKELQEDEDIGMLK